MSERKNKKNGPPWFCLTHILGQLILTHLVKRTSPLPPNVKTIHNQEKKNSPPTPPQECLSQENSGSGRCSLRITDGGLWRAGKEARGLAMPSGMGVERLAVTGVTSACGALISLGPWWALGALSWSTCRGE